jgi:hypothetical protein
LYNDWDSASKKPPSCHLIEAEWGTVTINPKKEEELSQSLDVIIQNHAMGKERIENATTKTTTTTTSGDDTVNDNQSIILSTQTSDRR